MKNSEPQGRKSSWPCCLNSDVKTGIKMTMVLTILVMLNGCATPQESHIMKTDKHYPALAIGDVKTYNNMPKYWEPVADLMVRMSGDSQTASDMAIASLKADAASLGANGIHIGRWKRGVSAGFPYQYINAKAFFVPDSH